MQELFSVKDRSLINSIISHYGLWIRSSIEDGWRPYFFTFMFKPLRGDRKAISLQMLDEIDRVYSTFLTRVVRDPKRCALLAKLDDHFGLQAWDDKRPLLIACLDGSSKKRDKQKRISITINDGLHAHGIMIVPSKSRLKIPVDEHFKQHKRVYARNRLLRIDVQPIVSNDYFVVDYGHKALKTGKADFDDMAIFPRAHDEPRGRRADPAS